MINLSPKKSSTKKNGDLIGNLDFDLDQKLLEAFKKHKKDDKLMPKLMTSKSILSIQNHI